MEKLCIIFVTIVRSLPALALNLCKVRFMILAFVGINKWIKSLPISIGDVRCLNRWEGDLLSNRLTCKACNKAELFLNASRPACILPLSGCSMPNRCT